MEFITFGNKSIHPHPVPPPSSTLINATVIIVIIVITAATEKIIMNKIFLFLDLLNSISLIISFNFFICFFIYLELKED